MGKLIILLACLIPLLLPSEPASRPAPVQLVLYAPAYKVEKGKVIDVVVEVVNTGSSDVVVKGHVTLEQVVPEPPGVVMLEQRADSYPPDDGKLRLTLLCRVPPGSMRRMLAARDLNHHAMVPDRIVAPGQSTLMKVGIPSSAFEIGSCSIMASWRDSAVKSQAFEIECVAPAEKKR